MNSHPTQQPISTHADATLHRQPEPQIRVALLTNSSNRVSLPVLASLSRAKHIALGHVLFYDTVSAARGSLLRVVRERGLRGTVAKACETLQRKARSWAFRGLGWKPRRPATCHEYVMANSIPSSVFPDLNGPAATSFANQLGIDILLVCSCSQILKRDILAVPRIASVNIHPSLLPRHRGPMPIFWTLYHGDTETGVTFHLVAEQIDGGDVIAQYPVAVAKNTTEQSLSDVLFQTAGDTVESVLLDFAAGRIMPMAQSSNGASYERFPTPRQRRELKLGALPRNLWANFDDSRSQRLGFPRHGEGKKNET